MKFSDIEKKIKKDAENIKVPEVLSRVKIAPLKSLGEGETPARAFKKNFTVALLVLTLVIFAVMTLTLFVFGTSDKTKSIAVSSSYIGVVVENGKATTAFGIVTDSLGEICAVTDETNGKRLSFNKNATISATILSVVDLKDGDKVRVATLNNNAKTAEKLAEDIARELTASGQKPIEISSKANDVERKLQLAKFLNGAVENCKIDVDSDIDDVAKQYLIWFSSLA
ncbi:MAG: hypothetical protein RSC44_04510 [Clostridia bacterium]